LPGRPAFALSVGWLETYSLSVSRAQSSRVERRVQAWNHPSRIH
jgi:hypothetical protein